MPVAVAMGIRSSLSDDPSDFNVAPRYVNIFTFSSNIPSN